MNKKNNKESFYESFTKWHFPVSDRNYLFNINKKELIKNHKKKTDLSVRNNMKKNKYKK